jgi:hypothetical protein
VLVYISSNVELQGRSFCNKPEQNNNISEWNINIPEQNNNKSEQYARNQSLFKRSSGSSFYDPDIGQNFEPRNLNTNVLSNVFKWDVKIRA